MIPADQEQTSSSFTSIQKQCNMNKKTVMKVLFY